MMEKQLLKNKTNHEMLSAIPVSRMNVLLAFFVFFFLGGTNRRNEVK